MLLFSKGKILSIKILQTMQEGKIELFPRSYSPRILDLLGTIKY